MLRKDLLFFFLKNYFILGTSIWITLFTKSSFLFFKTENILSISFLVYALSLTPKSRTPFLFGVFILKYR